MNIKTKQQLGQYDVNEETKQITFLDLRFYRTPEGEFFPSVTTILDAYPKGPAFFEWLKKNGEDADNIRDEAGAIGSTVHGLTEKYDNGEIVSLIDADGKIRYKSTEWKQFERYVEFSNQVQPQILRTEYNIISPNLRTAGTIDRNIYLDNGKVKGRFLLDIKTSNVLHEHYWSQLAAYVKLHEEAFPEEPIDGTCILWLNAKTRGASKTGAIQGKGWQLVFPDRDLEHYFNVFKATQLLWNEVNGDMKPNDIVYNIEHKK